jgi:allophanate hydrolase subunit 2
MSLQITKVVGLATIQDAGRRGQLHQGIPPGGALVPELLGRANSAADNPYGEAAIEAFGSITLVAQGRAQIGCDDGTTAELREGESWTLTCGAARVRYVAVRGGVDVPSVLGGRGTLLVASLGGLEGRALRAGDVLATGAAPLHRGQLPPPELDRQAPVVVIPGPDVLPGGALGLLLSSVFRVDARSDRVGIRLEGPRLPRIQADRGPSKPMLQGAIQLPPDGMPIVLGPDHPVTGGYPVIATVARRHQGRLGALPIGHEVRLVAAP